VLNGADYGVQPVRRREVSVVDHEQAREPRRDADFAIDEARPPSEIWWEAESGPSVWDGAPPPDDPVTADGWSTQLQAYPEGEPFEANTSLPLVWLALWSLVIGVAGLVMCHGLFGIVAVVYGLRARRRIADAPPGTRRGDGLAIAGIAIGAAAIAVGVYRFVAGAALLV
jgi:hypothetical protein